MIRMQFDWRILEPGYAAIRSAFVDGGSSQRIDVLREPAYISVLIDANPRDTNIVFQWKAHELIVGSQRVRLFFTEG